MPRLLSRWRRWRYARLTARYALRWPDDEHEPTSPRFAVVGDERVSVRSGTGPGATMLRTPVPHKPELDPLAPAPLPDFSAEATPPRPIGPVAPRRRLFNTQPNPDSYPH